LLVHLDNRLLLKSTRYISSRLALFWRIRAVALAGRPGSERKPTPQGRFHYWLNIAQVTTYGRRFIASQSPAGGPTTVLISAAPDYSWWETRLSAGCSLL